MYPKLLRCVTARQPVFFPMASSCRTSGRLASLSEPFIAIRISLSRDAGRGARGAQNGPRVTPRFPAPRGPRPSFQFLHHARRRVGPFPNDLLVIEEERVGGRADGEWRRRAHRGGELRIELI